MLASVFIITFVWYISAFFPCSVTVLMTSISSFAIGLGPVPFVIIPEVSPYHVSIAGLVPIHDPF